MSNFFYLLVGLIVNLSLGACVSQPVSPSLSSDGSQQVIEEETIEPTEEKTPLPKVGLILGAGGMRSFAHIGVLQAFEKAKIPVSAIVGMEWGALVAALYASKGSANDLEWQTFKLEKEDVYGGFLSSSRELQPTSRMSDYFQEVFSATRVEELAVPMACPVRLLHNGALAWVDRGRVGDGLRSCLSYPPFFQATQNRYAATFAVEEAVRYLRNQGIGVVIFINPIAAGPLFSEGIDTESFQSVLIWSRVREKYREAKNLADEAIGVYIEDVGIDSFQARRRAMKAGRSAASDVVQKLVRKYGF